MKSPAKLTFTIKEAAQCTGLSARTIRRMVDGGELTSCLLGGRRLVTASSLNQAIEAGVKSAFDGATLHHKHKGDPLTAGRL